MKSQRCANGDHGRFDKHRDAGFYPRKGKIMSTTGLIILIVVLIVLFGGGGGYYWSRRGR